MPLKLKGKKIGMTQLFDKEGVLVPCTVISITPNIVTAVKTVERDGYDALQLGVAIAKKKNLAKPQKLFFEKKNLPYCSHLMESRLDKPSEAHQLGSQINVDYFSDVAFVDIAGISKGKGYQGVMKLHGFAGGPASHGSSFHRHAGSTGMRTTPGRCLPGGKRASHMGMDQMTVQSMKVVAVDKEKGLLFVRGAVPGAKNGMVVVSKAIKKKRV